MQNLKSTLGVAIVAASMLLLAASAVYAQPAQVTWAHTAVNVTTGSGAVLAANVERKWAIIENDSDFNIYCKIGAAAVLNQGIRINAAGGSLEISSALNNYTTDAINCIHGDAGNKVMLVTEGS